MPGDMYQNLKTVRNWLKSGLSTQFNPFCDLPGFAEHMKTWYNSELGKEVLGEDMASKLASAWKSMKSSYKHMVNRTPREIFSWKVKTKATSYQKSVSSYGNGKKNTSTSTGIKKENPYNNFKKQ